MKSLFPWYDSQWLSAYVHTKQFLQLNDPQIYEQFETQLQPLKTRLDFQTQSIPQFFDAHTLEEIRHLIAELKESELEKHEALRFGRMVVHDHGYFNQLQVQLVSLVSDYVGEWVEPSYNFLSLYNNLGVCGLHMDSPYAKYTLDICIEQSQSWPIYFSPVQPWPEDFEYSSNWMNDIKNDPDIPFTAYTLEPGNAVIFSGSSQWHYRDRIPRLNPKQREQNFCHLLFLHYVPQGMCEKMRPSRWAKQFNVPEINAFF